MKPALKIASHLGAVAVGLALAATALPLMSSSPSADTEKSKTTRKTGGDSASSGKAPGKRTRAPAGENRSAAYRAAWAALAKEPLSLADRFAAQRNLLAEWAKYDLDDALQACLAEAWDNPDPADPWVRPPLGSAFSAIFAEQPLESWRALSRDKMALNLLGGFWVNSVSQKEPGLLVAMLGELPGKFHNDALTRIFSKNSSLPPAQREELLAKLAASGTPAQAEKWLSQVYRNTRETGDPVALAAKWSAMPAGGPRMLQMTAWASSLGGADTARFSAEWEKVPVEDRAQAARLLLAQVNNNSPALTYAIDRAIETGQWDSLKDGVADKLRGFNTDRQALAEWALKLPPREEVRAIFNLSISEKLLNDPVGGRQWLEQLPPGDWHREYGFIEMTLGSLWARGDIGAANRAIDAITDPRAREEALKCRYDWQLITTQPGILRED